MVLTPSPSASLIYKGRKLPWLLTVIVTKPFKLNVECKTTIEKSTMMNIVTKCKEMSIN